MVAEILTGKSGGIETTICGPGFAWQIKTSVGATPGTYQAFL